MTKICFRALPMPQFTNLQKRVFPAYFKIQVGLVALTVVTHPPMSVVSLLHWWGDYVPLTVALGISALNMLVYGPKTQEVMVERIHQGEHCVLFSLWPRKRHPFRRVSHLLGLAIGSAVSG